MRSNRYVWCAVLAFALAVRAVPVPAQNVPSAAPDSVYRRAQRMASEGNTAGARALVDSMLAGSPEGSALYADALFWRATLAESAEQARRDYLRLAIEYSRSARAEDALLRLAQIDLAKGDHAGAKKHLDRLSLEHPGGAVRAQAAYWMGRVLFEEGAMSEGCAFLADARARVSDSEVELTRQISYYARQCVNVQMANSAPVDSMAHTATRMGKPADASPEKNLGKSIAPRALTWSAQVAAYPNREDADRLASVLRKRGYAARVTSAQPYRVRIGRFTKRSDALLVVRQLKDAKMMAIVVEERP